MPKRPIQIEDILRLRVPSDPRVAPDGSRVAFTLRSADMEACKYRSHIWLAAPGRDPEPLTHGGVEDSSPRWSPDGTRLAFVHSHEGTSQVWWLPSEGGNPRPLTTLPPGKVQGLAWSPDGRRLAFAFRPKSAYDPKNPPTAWHVTRLVYKVEGQGWRDTFAQLWTADAVTGEARAIVTGDFDAGSPAWSPDGARLAFPANLDADADYATDHMDLWVVPAAGGSPSKIAAPRGPKSGLAWSPDGRWIAYFGHDKPRCAWGAANVHPWVVPAAGGDARDLAAGHDRTWEDETITDTRAMHSMFQPVVWTPDGRAILGVVNDRGASHVYRAGLEGGVERILGGERVISQLSIARNSSIAYLAADFNDVGDIYLGDARLTRVNGELLDSIEVSRPEEFTAKSFDGTEVQAWLLRPPRAHAGKVPLALEIHGGPRTQYGYLFFHEFHLLAAQGYAVLFSNPRGSQGRGEAFTSAIVNDWGNLDSLDLMAVTDAALARGGLDESRMCVMGGSYGGYMTNWIVGHTDRFRCGVTMRCVSNLVSMAGTSDYGYEDYREFGAHAWDAPETYWRMSPVAYAAKIRTPLLILHSEGDLRCPIEQAEQLYTFLKGQRKEVELVRFPEENHDLSRAGRPDRRLERLRHILRWLGRYLG